mgnify:CR=1 FL=1
MRDAVIVSTARTPLAKSIRGAFNATHPVQLGAWSVEAAVARAGIDGEEIEDVVMGAASQGGAQGFNIGRQIALRAGLPVDVAGMTIDRQCSSGLMAIATAAKQIIVDRMDVCVAGGIESITAIRNNTAKPARDEELLRMHPDIFMPMIGTAEVVAKRYGISREDQDAYSLQSQQRTAAAQTSGKFSDEIIEVSTTMDVKDRESGEERTIELEGVFVQIGLVPNTEWLEESGLELTKHGEIATDEEGRTNLPGVFGAGDVTDVPYKQIVVAMGEGSKAGLSAFDYLIRTEPADEIAQAA